MDEISLTAGIRNSLFDLQNIANQVHKTQQRLSTGNKINSALENATNYFAAQDHLNRAGDLNSYKDGIREAIQVAKAAYIGMDAITSVLRQASAIAESAMFSANAKDLAQHAQQFNEMRNQVDMLSADSGYQGIDLLRRQDLTVDFGNSHSLTIQGEDITSSGFDDMTNGLSVETASMDPLNIVTPNFVMTSAGAIKEDGELSITNNNVPEIDAWLGDVGIKHQVLTSQDVTLSTNKSFSDGITVVSQILDNVGVAEYGTGGFDIYRDTSATAAVTAGSGSVIGTNVLQVTDVSRFLGPLLSDGSKPFILERTLTAGTEVVSGAASIDFTNIVNPADVYACLGPLAGSGSQTVELYRDMAASTTIVGDPATVNTTIINYSDVADLLGALTGLGSQSFQLHRDITADAAVTGAPAAVTAAHILDNSGVADFLGALTGSGSKPFQLYRDVTAEAAVAGNPTAVENTVVSDNSAVADFLGLAGPRYFTLSRDVDISSAIASATGSVVTLDKNAPADIAGFIGLDPDKSFKLIYNATSQSWSSSDVSHVTNSGGPPSTAIGIDLIGIGTSITANIGGTWSDGDSITITAKAGDWESDNPDVGVDLSGTKLNLNLNGDSSSDMEISLSGALQADTVIGVKVAATGWKTSNPSVSVVADGNSLDLELNSNGVPDMRLSLAGPLRSDAVIGVDAKASDWISNSPSVKVVSAIGTSLGLDLNNNNISDMQISLASKLKADAVIQVVATATDWKITGPPATVTASGTTLALDLNGNGVTDLTVELGALSKADTRLDATSYLSSWHSTAFPDISVNPTGTYLSVNLGFDGADDLGITLASLLHGDAKITATTKSSIWKTTDPNIDLNQPTVAGIMTADLNGDGLNDMQIDLPGTGPNSATWLSTEDVHVATTGPFRTTDPSVTLKYDHQTKTLGLRLGGSTGGTDITIGLSETWAVNGLPVSPLGNGDAIDLTVDGRHRWVKGDGFTPNVSGMRLSMSEIGDAINSLRLNSQKDSTNLSVLTDRSDFIDKMAALLQTGAENLTLADLNEEGANLLLLQTRQNLATTSMSISSKAAQSILKLFT